MSGCALKQDHNQQGQRYQEGGNGGDVADARLETFTGFMAPDLGLPTLLFPD